MARNLALGLMFLTLAGGIGRAQDVPPPGPHRAGPDAKPIASVAGVYLCQGQNPDGSPYEGIVEIVRLQSSFLVRWTLPDDVTVMGVGIERGGVLSVSYFGGTPGIIVYKADEDDVNTLRGEWTMGGAHGQVFSETLRRIEIKGRRPGVPAPAPTRGTRI